MPIDFFVTKELIEAKTKTLTLLMRQKGDIRQSEVSILVTQDIRNVDLDAAWLISQPMHEPLRAWTSYEARDATGLFSGVVLAMLQQLKDGGGVDDGNTLDAITVAGRDGFTRSPQYITDVTRLASLFKAADAEQQGDFIALVSVIVFGALRDP